MAFTAEMDRCIAGYVGAPDEAARAEAFDGLVQWLAASHEADGRSEREIGLMDLEAEARRLVGRARDR